MFWVVVRKLLGSCLGIVGRVIMFWVVVWVLLDFATVFLVVAKKC